METHRTLFVTVVMAFVLSVGFTATASGDAVDCGEVEFDGGDGEESPYEISSVEHLQCMEEDHQADYRLVDDVDASDTADWNEGAGFRPVGGDPEAGEPVFEETFDGEGHSIYNLTIDRPTEEYVGLFTATAPGAKVRDVELHDVDVEGGTFVGSLVGFNEGGLNETYSSGEVTGIDVVGGLVGSNDRDTVSYSRSSATVSGIREIGGLAGQNFEARVERSKATGDVEAEDIAGGLVGDNPGWIDDSYATGDVTADTAAGGLVGQNIFPFADDFYRGEIRRSYSTGYVDGAETETTGGLVGVNRLEFQEVEEQAEATVEESYWDVEASGVETSDGGTPLNTDEMTGEASTDNMEGLNFDDVWTTTESYPEIQGFQDTEAETDEEEGLPGFGALAFLAALTGLAAARLHR